MTNARYVDIVSVLGGLFVASPLLVIAVDQRYESYLQGMIGFVPFVAMVSIVTGGLAAYVSPHGGGIDGLSLREYVMGPSVRSAAVVTATAGAVGSWFFLYHVSIGPRPEAFFSQLQALATFLFVTLTFTMVGSLLWRRIS